MRFEPRSLTTFDGLIAW